jgi:hypothetical protein
VAATAREMAASAREEIISRSRYYSFTASPSISTRNCGLASPATCR